MFEIIGWVKRPDGLGEAAQAVEKKATQPTTGGNKVVGPAKKMALDEDDFG